LRQTPLGLHYMPLYEYKCNRCSKIFEVIQKFSDAPLEAHEECGGALERLISRSSLRFKGTGWYVTDYPANGKGGPNGKADKDGKPEGKGKNESKPDSNGKSESQPGGKSESKPESKTETKPAPATTDK
jgi:putative FmdB family regulatory protein